MNEQQQLIAATTRRIMSDLCTRGLVDDAEAGIWPKALWQTMETSGLTKAGVSERAGGSGGEIADAMLVMRHSAEFGAPLPLAETFLVALLMESVGCQVPAGPLGLITDTQQLELAKSGSDYLLSGQGTVMGWVAESTNLVSVHQSDEGALVCIFEPKHCTLARATNIAGEPRYDLQCAALRLKSDCVHLLPAPWSKDRVVQAGALARSVMMAGALDSILTMCVQYAQDRQQFGRPIAAFQAIQHQLAVLAGQVAAAGKAADLAVEAWGSPHESLRIAAAKARVGEAAGISTEIAHQVHGAIGFTQEHPLHHRTRRLWAWRDEFGNESVWRRKLGLHLCGGSADLLWQRIIDL